MSSTFNVTDSFAVTELGAKRWNTTDSATATERFGSRYTVTDTFQVVDTIAVHMYRAGVWVNAPGGPFTSKPTFSPTHPRDVPRTYTHTEGSNDL